MAQNADPELVVNRSGSPGLDRGLPEGSPRSASSNDTKTAREPKKEVVVPKTQDHQITSNPTPLKICTASSAFLETAQDVSRKRKNSENSPETGKSEDLSPTYMDPQEHNNNQKTKRQSWRRASMKETNRRKSLPPFHQGITELSRSISIDLAESKRLGCLLLSSFEFSAKKLELFLKDVDGISLDTFRDRVSSISKEFKHFTKKLEDDGTLQKCSEESKGQSTDIALEASMTEIKEYIARLSLECMNWDQLLLHHQKIAEEISRLLSPQWLLLHSPWTLEEAKITDVQIDPALYLQSSQSKILSTKPDYQKILDSQNEVFNCMEMVMDELQGSIRLLYSFMETTTLFFKKVSVQLGKRTAQQLETSPIRKLLNPQLQKSSLTF
ncbi:kinetochore-associated protein DSN1 homolog isoform X1 [Monodelphis domestica]|uniref:kinetochore-associated protein DSN1 homolog isoform X1 n=1 Tax=Monodelphis domestica TaxID=13616 RepID=UPI0024E1B5B8|nr:kinetochore-associated protein DSN1 homolog isoform X1 [Monodelphis domestica]